MFLLHDPEEFRPSYSEGGAGSCGRGCRHAQSRIGFHRLLSEKVICRNQPNCGFLAGSRCDRDLHAALLEEDAQLSVARTR
jgi:hypothetical protein